MGLTQSLFLKILLRTMWLPRSFLVLVATYQVLGCQPELKDDAASLVTVQYDRQGEAAIYVDRLNVEMKDKKKFSHLLKPGCNGRRDVNMEIRTRPVGTKGWLSKGWEIRITAKSFDRIEVDPCEEYEVKVIIKSLKGREARELPTFIVGPFHKLPTSEVAISKFKGDLDKYINDNFQYEYQDITDHSFTIKWEPICALIMKVWVKGQDEEWNDVQEKQINNNISNPTTEITFDVEPCTIVEVAFDFYVDSAGMYQAEKELEALTTDPSKEVLKSMFSEHSYENNTKEITWDYSQFIDQLDCIDRFKYNLVKDENGDLKKVLEGTDKDVEARKFPVSSVEGKCNFAVRMEVEYVTIEGHKDSIEGFEIHILKENQKDNEILEEEANITYAINPCVEPKSEIVIGLVEVGNADKERQGRNLPGQDMVVTVDKSATSMERSQFEEMDLKSCVAYKIMLLRRSGNQNFKELETAEFPNPNWDSWKSPNISEITEDKSSTSVAFKITDLETDGECGVNQYKVKCALVGESEFTETSFHHNEKLTIENLLPESSYNCSGKIVHTIPESGDFETPWSDYVIIMTSPAPTTPAPEPEPAIDADSEPEPEDQSAPGPEDQSAPEPSQSDEDAAGSKDESNSSIPIEIALIVVVVFCAGACYYWNCIKKKGEAPQDANKDVAMSYSATAAADTKDVEMNSDAVVAPESQQKDIEAVTVDEKETVINIPEDEKPVQEPEDDQKKDMNTSEPDVKDTAEEDKATTSTEGISTEKGNDQTNAETVTPEAKPEVTPDPSNA